ncbi:hypothetical protein BDV93DRAFT_526277 [Ceratobasidium sp. AG-I]|nr:hypothetical protein BDV93DRAFT_526277 [Ceratobasidium sp. AG-I]
MVNRRALVLPEMRFYNLRLRTWSQPVYVPGRYRHSAALIPSARNTRLLIIGGRDMRGNLSKETLIIDVKAAFHSLRYTFSADKPPAEDYGQGVYWSWLAGLVQPLGPYYNHCHLVPHGDSFVIFALPDRTSASPSAPQQSFQSASSYQSTSSTRSQPRSSEQSTHRYDSYNGHSGWALSFSGGSASLRELRKLRRAADRAELEARSKAALVQALVKSRPPLQQPRPHPQHLLQPPAPVTLVPTPTPNQGSSASGGGSGSPWLWCGVVRSGWGTPTNGEEDLLLMMYQADGQIFLVPVLLSALGVLRSTPNLAPDTGFSLAGLLPPLWDGTPHAASTKLDPSTHPYPDFLLHTSTPHAPPLALHRSILSARSTYFDSLLKSGFSEARTGEASIEEGYDAAYALCYWIYTNTLPTWLESPGSYAPTLPSPPPPSSSSYFPSLPETELFRLEAQYASHAASTLCDLLTAASARMLPALAMRTRALIRAEHMKVPEVAPVLWRAAEVTDVDEGEDLIRMGQEDAKPSQESGPRGTESAPQPEKKQEPNDWVYDVVRSRMRPSEDRRQFMSAVLAWCCDPTNSEVRTAMESAQEWLEPGVWKSWVQRCAKMGKEREEKDVVMSA